MKTRTWVGRVLSALPVLVLLMSATMKFVRPTGFDDGLAHMGLPASLVAGLGVLEILCTVIYLVPRTAVLGAILLAGYLGGAIAIHIRVGDPFLVQFVLGVMLWGGLYLRDARLQAFIPLVRD